MKELAQYLVKELVYDNGAVVFSGSEEDCRAYVRALDKGYAGVRPCFVISPAPEETK